MPIELRRDGPTTAACRLILAHGAGQDMDAPFMRDITQRVAGSRLQVIRFNFPYMVKRLETGRQRPPDRQPVLLAHWRRVIEQVRAEHSGPLFIGGKSLGGRMASLLADEQQVAGLVCLGYPFHPPGKPQRLRTEHLLALQTPTLICQGERDGFGNRQEVSDYRLPPNIRLHWLRDGDHSFKPRKASGLSLSDNLEAAATAVLDFIRRLT
ncbi:MAG: dienelactone hydrolase family protein [Chromatiales bacterium]|jgi:predicted alpha/beta-hydrolase family hydrolase